MQGCVFIPHYLWNGEGYLAVKQHGAAIIAFGPQVVRRFATRKDRIDPRPNIVGDPVHVQPLLAMLQLK